MSSRVFRRLQGKDNFIDESDENNDTRENDVTCKGGARRKTLPVNPFDLLDEDSQSETDVKEDSEVEALESIVSDNSKKKKKKKKKSVKPVPSNYGNYENDELDLDFTIDLDDNTSGNKNENKHSSSNKYDERPSERYSSAMSVKLKNLNANNELKKIFGTKIIQDDNGKRKSHGRTPIKHYCLVKPKENWPPLGKTGISMKVEKVNGETLFAFVHSKEYQKTQLKFLSAVNSLNPDNIARIMHTHPYHVDTLIQLSDLYKLNDDLQMAAELIERALYCLQAAFHPLFNIAQGNCQLDYRREENRAFFICLFKHLNFVGQRACYQTALELCKLLLSLDFETDPMAVILSMDFYSLRSQNYVWLINAVNELEKKKNLTQLPNFAYSTALAHFYKVDLDNSTDWSMADKLLQDALILFPGALSQLIEKCSIQWDSVVSQHPYFTSEAENHQSNGLSKLIKLYVHRTYHEWKNPKVLPWLERNVHAVLSRVDSGDPFVKECLQKRSKRYHSIPRNVLRHIILSDIKEVSSTVTRDLSTPILGFDPLPPLDSVDLYPHHVRQQSSIDAPTIALLFRSLLPDFNIHMQPGNPLYAEVMEGNDDAVGLNLGAQGNNAPSNTIGDTLRHSVTMLMDAIGLVLANMPERYLDFGSDDEDDDGDDNNEHRLESEREELVREIARYANGSPAGGSNHSQQSSENTDDVHRQQQE